MRWLCLALILIRAILPLGEDVKERAEELRQVAVAAGCANPVLLMWTEDGHMELEISCPK